MEDQKYCPVCGEPLNGRFCANCGFDTDKTVPDVRAELTSDADRPTKPTVAAKTEETARPTAKNKPVREADRAVFEAVPEPGTENAARIARDAEPDDEIRSFEEAKEYLETAKEFVGTVSSYVETFNREKETAKEYVETAKEFVGTVRRYFENAERDETAGPTDGARKESGNAVRIANASRVFGAVFSILGFLLMLAPAGVRYGARFESVYRAMPFEPLYSVVVFCCFLIPYCSRLPSS